MRERLSAVHQIIDRMTEDGLQGHGLPYEIRQEPSWRFDNLPDAHSDDRLWGYMIRAAEEFRLGQPEDPVLYDLMRMGIFDWRGDNDNPRLNQATQAIRHSTALASRILPQILNVEKKVRPPDLSFLCK
jgi:hypothetical protein